MKPMPARWARASVLLLMLTVGGAARAAEKDAAPARCLLWEVRSKTATVYLLGSIHMSDKSMYPLDPSIEQAFERSDALVLEIGLTPEEQARAALLMVQAGAYPPGETLETNLSPAGLQKLRAALEKRGTRLEQANGLRPWFLALTLAVQECMRLGFAPDLGQDVYFRNKAMAQKKPLLGLETVEEQLAILSGGTKEEQELWLLDTIDQLDKTKAMLDRMVKAWKTGDAKGLDGIVQETRSRDPGFEPVLKRLFDDRNAKMAVKIEGFLKTDQTHFVVVGSGHLVGEKGIVRLLRDKGYTVKQVEQAAAREAAPASAAP